MPELFLGVAVSVSIAGGMVKPFTIQGAHHVRIESRRTSRHEGVSAITTPFSRQTFTPAMPDLEVGTIHL